MLTPNEYIEEGRMLPFRYANKCNFILFHLLSKTIEVSQPGKNGGRLGILEMVFLHKVIH